MSINAAMNAGVSGLVANSAALGAISDNIANTNTVGYKENQTSFEDLVTAKAAAGAYNPGGVLAITRQLVSQQGQFQQTSSGTDLGISGNGFFVVTDKATGVSAGDARSFTRAGSFSTDSAGYLKNTAGYYLQGWIADPVTGAISPDPSDLTKLQTINIASIANVPNPSANAGVKGNLNAAQPISAAVSGATYNAATNSMAMYDASPTTGVKPDFSMQIPVYDSQGGKRTLQLDMLKSTTANQWYAELNVIPASDVSGATNGTLLSGKIAFNPDGTYDAANTTLFGSPANTTLDIGASAAGAGARWASALGLADQKITINIAGLTQYDSPSALASTTVDGGPSGSLSNVQVDKNGYVVANFDNGASRRIAQIALATFLNADGLSPISGNAYRASIDSGGFTLKQPTVGGAGALSPSTLESSTVDLSAEFTGLITTQRAYSASSKIITTADEMLQALLDLKR